MHSKELTSEEQSIQKARDRAREVLSQSQSFRALPRSEQFNIYRNTVDQEYQKLTYGQNGGIHDLSESMFLGGFANFIGRTATRAGNMIMGDFSNERIDSGGREFAELVREVDFPGFVRDLVVGVYDANIQATAIQMESFQKLLKEATKSLAEFVTAIPDTDAMLSLARKEPKRYRFMSKRDQEGKAISTLQDARGRELNTERGQIATKIMDTKIEMAREHRALLRETLLLGVTRLVVQEGKIDASVIFDFYATEDKTFSPTGGARGLFSFLTVSPVRQKVEGSTSTEMSANLTGSVSITFKSDYFQLDNFAKMYGKLTDDEEQETKDSAGSTEGGKVNEGEVPANSPTV